MSGCPRFVIYALTGVLMVLLCVSYTESYTLPLPKRHLIRKTLEKPGIRQPDRPGRGQRLASIVIQQLTHHASCIAPYANCLQIGRFSSYFLLAIPVCVCVIFAVAIALHTNLTRSSVSSSTANGGRYAMTLIL